MTQEKNKQTALWTKIALAGLIATLPLQLAKADTIVAPAGFENVEGGADNSYPIGNSGINAVPYQQIFDASLFGSSPILISSFAFRADDIMPLASGNIIDLASLQVTMSTTSKLVDGLDTTIANNLGIDATMVINDTGGRKLSSDLSKDENGITYDFDYIFAFDAPFLYDPDQGNLIFQIDATYGPASWITVFDAHGTHGFF